jgi:hypothetical protein
VIAGDPSMPQVWLPQLLALLMTSTGEGPRSAATPGAKEVAPRAVYTSGQIRAALAEAQAKIRSLRVVYRSYDYDQGKYPKGTYLHREIEARAPYDLRHVSAHGYDGLDWRDDPLQQHAYVTKGHAINEFPINRVFAENDARPEEGLPGSLPQEPFFLATGIWPHSGWRPPRAEGRAFVLREVAAEPEYRVVRPVQELVDRRWCHVLERPGLDRLWLDVERGCALLARESSLKVGGPLVDRIELGEHRQVADGVWLPGWIRNIQFDFNAPTEEGRRRAYQDARLVIIEAQANREADPLTFRARPGELRGAAEGAPTQVLPGGQDHLDDVARWLVRHVAIARSDGHSLPVYLAAAPVLVLILVWELRRALVRNNPAQTTVTRS